MGAGRGELRRVFTPDDRCFGLVGAQLSYMVCAGWSASRLTALRIRAIYQVTEITHSYGTSQRSRS